MLYFVLLIIFLVLFVAPSLAGKYVPTSMLDMLSSLYLVQPTGQNNNDTISSQTGTGAKDYSGALQTMTSGSGTGTAAAASSTGDSAKIRLF